MNYKQLRSLYKKEILDVIRDKKTILMMVVLPVILYPVLFLVIMQVVNLVLETQEEQTYYIAYDNVSQEDAKTLNDWIAGEDDDLQYVFKEIASENPSEDLKAEKIDAYITVNDTEDQKSYVIHYLYAESNSNTAAGMLKEEVESLSKHVAEKNAVEQGFDVKRLLYPVVVELDDQSSNESSMGSMLGGIIPFLLIASLVMGCLYPSIDATAGEKERGTLETLLTLPIGNMELIASKFLSVATIAVVSVFMNVISMGGVVIYLYTTMTALSENTAKIDLLSFVPALLISIICVIAFALFISALTMIVCSFAKSFKEANNYTTPISLVIMLTGYIGIIPTVELNTTLALVPVANICLLIKNLLVFKYDFTLIVLVLLSNIIYAFVAIWVLAKIYNSESILFGESFSGMKFFELRKNIKKGSLPTIQESVLVMVVALLLMVYVGGMVSVSAPAAISLVVQQIFVGILPLLAALYIKADMKKVFCLKLPKVRHFFGALVFGAGAISLNMVISSLLTMAFPSGGEDVNEMFDTILEGVPFGVGLLLIALLPAVCEELMYRGYMLTAFKNRLSLGKSILIVSLLFGVSHMSMIKILPTAILGVCLAYMIHSSGSILTSTIIHFMNNGLSVVLMYYGSQIPFFTQEQYTIPVLIVFAVVACLCLPAGLLMIKEKK